MAPAALHLSKSREASICVRACEFMVIRLFHERPRRRSFLSDGTSSGWIRVQHTCLLPVTDKASDRHESKNLTD